jgi:TnpA family transposase
MNRSANYGAPNGVARHRINTKLIADNWDDLPRVVGSLKMDTVRTSEVLRSLHLGSRPSRLARTIGEVGLVAKTPRDLILGHRKFVSAVDSFAPDSSQVWNQ